MMPELAKWDGFYVIVGSAAGALIGLQFVVITLIAQTPAVRAPEAGAAFAVPRSFTSAPLSSWQLSYTPHGKRSRAPQSSGGCLDSAESCTG